MSLIFDHFRTIQQASGFQKVVEQRFPEHRTHMWMSQDQMEALFNRQLRGDASAEEAEIEADMFPWVLTPPIVLVGRLEHGEHEDEIEQLVQHYGGEFAGT